MAGVVVAVVGVVVVVWVEGVVGAWVDEVAVALHLEVGMQEAAVEHMEEVVVMVVCSSRRTRSISSTTTHRHRRRITSSNTITTTRLWRVWAVVSQRPRIAALVEVAAAAVRMAAWAATPRHCARQLKRAAVRHIVGSECSCSAGCVLRSLEFCPASL
jgi:hypothetical protein